MSHISNLCGTFVKTVDLSEECVLPVELFTLIIQHGVILLVFHTRIATVDMVYGMILVPCDSQLWSKQCTWSSYRNNQITIAGKFA